MHEKVILCAEMLSALNFVHERAILYTKLIVTLKFVLDMKVICTKLSEKRCFAGGPHSTVGRY